MKNTVLVFTIMISWNSFSYGQQLPQYTQHMFNKLAINPAVTGSEKYVDLGMSHRSQWTGFDGAPRTQIFYAHGKVDAKNYGVGGYIYNDKTGPIQNTGLNASYAYHLQVKDDMQLSFGLAGSVGQFSVNGNEIELDDETDELVDLNTISGTLVPEASAGFYLFSDAFYIGFSTMHLTENKVSVFKSLGTNTVVNLVRHHYLMGGYRLSLEDEIDFIPSVLINKAKNNPTQADVNISIKFTDFQFGLTYRTDDAMALLINIEAVEFLGISYSYDIQTSKLKNNSNGSHEIMVRYKLFTNELSKKLYLQKRSGATN